MDKKTAKQKVKEYFRGNNYVSYVELQRLFDDIGYEYRGDLLITSETNEHVVFWAGWNSDGIGLLNELQGEGAIHKEPTQFLTYLLDGAGLDMPIVKRAVNYKRDHWLPVVFCRGRRTNGGK